MINIDWVNYNSRIIQILNQHHLSMNNWLDVTDEIFALSKGLSFLELVLHPDLPLEDTMHAHQINDPKIDPKYDICEAYTVSKLVEQDEIRPAQDLDLKEIKNVYAEILKQQALVLQTHPLAQTIYTFTYLYQESLWKNSAIVAPLVESINCMGTYIYELNKEACSVKEDDISFSTFSFRKNVKTHDQVAQDFLKAEKEVETILKLQKNASNLLEGKQLLAHIRFRRSLHNLMKFFGKEYDFKNQAKIQNEMKTVKKRLSELQTLIQKSKLPIQLPKGIFSQTVFKTLRSHFSYRSVIEITIQQALNELKNAIDQFQLFFPPPTNLSQLKYKLDILSSKPFNIWSKSYIKYNVFLKQSYIFKTIKTEDALLNDIKEWANINQEVRTDQKFQSMLRLSAPSVSQTLYRLTARNSRWFWETSKAYEDFNVMIHLANEIDSKYNEKKKQTRISSWFYNWTTTLMIRQLLWGFEQDLYEPFQYHLVAYQLEYILHINERNNQFLLNRFDKSILESFYDGTLSKNKKKKKLLSDLEKKSLTDSLFLKGLHYYFRSFYRLILILINRNHIADPFKNEIQLRFNNRFRIFKGILFLKRLTHESYLKEVGIVLQQQNKILQQASQLLKSAKTIFNLFGQFQEGETYFRQREQAVVLQKLSVKLSLVVITLKLKQPKKFSLKKEYPKYPQIQIS